MSIKSFVNDPYVYPAFKEVLEKKILHLQKSLEATTVVHDIYRLQGQITALRRLLTLREEINDSEKSYG